jgi:hypothetical protein
MARKIHFLRGRPDVRGPARLHPRRPLVPLELPLPLGGLRPRDHLLLDEEGDASEHGSGHEPEHEVPEDLVALEAEEREEGERGDELLRRGGVRVERASDLDRLAVEHEREGLERGERDERVNERRVHEDDEKREAQEEPRVVGREAGRHSEGDAEADGPGIARRLRRRQRRLVGVGLDPPGLRRRGQLPLALLAHGVPAQRVSCRARGERSVRRTPQGTSG